MNKKLLFFFMAVAVATASLQAQITSAGTGNWGTGTTWVGGVVPTASDDVVIANGHTVTLESGSKNCKNLTVQNGATLLTSAIANTLNLSGDVLIDGTIGSASTGVLFQFLVTGKVYGLGTCYFSKFRPNTDGITITIDMDAIGAGAASSFINCNAKTPFTFELKAGRTLTLPVGAYISTQSNSSTNYSTTGANVTWNIYGTINAPVASGGGFSLANPSGFTSTLNVYNGAIINTGRLSAIDNANPGVINVNIFNGGTININGGTSVTTNDMSKATLNVEGSFSAGTNIVSNTIGNFTLNNSTGIALASATTVSNNLTINAGNLDLGSFTHSAAKLYIVPLGWGVTNGSWGSTSSTATNQNDTYFGGTGSLNVATSTLSVGKNDIKGFEVYPNPVSNGKVFISSANIGATRTVQVFDILGKQVVSQKGIQTTAEVSHLNKGVYIIKVTEDGKVATRKLVIE